MLREERRTKQERRNTIR